MEENQTPVRPDIKQRFENPAPNTTAYIVSDLAKKNLTAEGRMNTQIKKQQLVNNLIPTNDKISLTRDVNINEMYTPVGDELVPIYKNYEFGTDNNERLARQQSTGEKWSNGLKKAGVNLGTTVLGGTIGSVTGVANWISSGFEMNALYTDEFNVTLDEVNEKLNYTLPNYYTKQEQDYNFGQSLGTANFWANDLSKGISFTLGSIVSEGIWAVATGGASLGGTAARWSLRASGLSKVAKGVNTYQKLGKKLIRAGYDKGAVQKIIGNAKTASNIGKGFNTARFMYTSAGYEAGVEARQMMKEAEENFEQYFKENYGRLPNAQEQAEFDKNVTSAANSLWTGNLALVGGSNLAIFGKMFNLSNPLLKSGRIAFKKGIDKSIYGIGSTTRKEGGKLIKEAIKPSKLQYTAGLTNAIARGPIIEGFWEEGNQSVMGNLADDWLKSGYDKKRVKESYDMMGAIYDSYAQTYGSKEGWKEVGIGMMVGLIGGGIGGSFTSYNKKLKQNQAYIAETSSKTFGTQATVDKMFANSQIISANKAEEEAENKGDYTAAKNARDRAILSNVALHKKYDRLDQGYDDFAKSLELVDAKKVAEEQGISIEEVKDYKSAVLQEYKEIQDTYSEYRDFAETVVGQNVATKDLEDIKSKSLLADAVAYNMTMGERSEGRAKILLDEFVTEMQQNVLGTDLKNAMDVNHAIATTTKERFKVFERAQRDYNKVNTKVKQLERKILAAQRKLQRLGTDKTEAKQKETAQLTELNQQLVDLKEQIPLAEQAYEEAYQTMKTTNPFAETGEVEGDFVTMSAEELNKVSEIDSSGNLVGGTLKKLEDNLKRLKESNPQKYQRAVKLLNEYKKSVYSFKEFNKTLQGISNPNFKPTNLVTKLEQAISKLRGETANEFTRDFYAGVGEQMQGNVETDEIIEGQTTAQGSTTPGDSIQSYFTSVVTDREYEDFKKNKRVSKQRLDNIARKMSEQQPLSKREKEIAEVKVKEIGERLDNIGKESEVARLDNILKEALEQNSLIADYIGNGVEKKPTQKETEEFKALHRKARSGKYKSYSIIATGDPKALKERQGDKINMTLEEIERYQELNKKFTDWQVIEGTTIGGINASIADIIIRLEQFKQDPKTNETSETIGNKEAVTIEEASNKNSGGLQENKDMLQTNEGVYLKVHKNGNRILSHMPLSAMLESYLPLGIRKVSIKLPNKKGIKEIDIRDLPLYEKTEGNVFFVEFDNNEVLELRINKHAASVFTEENWNKIKDSLKLKFVLSNPSDPQRNSWIMAYQEMDDGNLMQAKSEFEDDNQGRPKLTTEELYNLESVSVDIDPKNTYNKKLVDNLKKAIKSGNQKAIDEARQTLKAQMAINLVSEGKIAGLLRAGLDNLNKGETSSAYKDIREKAAQALEKTTTENIIPLNINIPINFKYSGSPIFNLKTVDGQATVQNKSITKKDVDLISDAGYVQNGEITIGGKVDKNQVIKIYLPKTKEKLPIVVVKYRGENIAFPVSLKEKPANVVDNVAAIIADKALTPGQIVNQINEVLLDNGIEPKTVNLKESDLSNQKKLQELEDMLSKLTTFASVDNMATKNYNLNNLRVDAEISINLQDKPFNTPKIRLALKEKTSTLPIEEELRQNFEEVGLEKPNLQSAGLKDQINQEQNKEC